MNFKCPPSAAAGHPGRRAHKKRAVAAVAAGLRRAIARQQAERLTFVPIPTSKITGHADYDDRLELALRRAFAGYDADIRLLLRQTSSVDSDHAASERISPDALHRLLEVDLPALRAAPLRQGIVLFDDVLTTGKHFKCCERRLRDVVQPAFPILGLFVARRMLPGGPAV